MERYLAAVQTVMALAACVAVVVAAYGLRTWKHQVDSAMARRVLVATYKLRDVVQRARGSVRPEKLDFDEAWERFDRWQTPIGDAMAELEGAAVEADATWGQTTSSQLTRFNEFGLLVLKAILMWSLEAGETRLKMPDGGELPAGAIAFSPTAEDDPVYEKLLCGFSRTKEGPDPFRRSMLEAVAQIEAAMKPRLRP